MRKRILTRSPDQHRSAVSAWRRWSTATRPTSLLVAIGPVIVGTAAAIPHTPRVNVASLILMAWAAVSVQAICNLQNDVGFASRGGDICGTRIGLPRATSNGWLTHHQVRSAIYLLVALAGIPCGLLLMTHGWPVLLIGLLSIIPALAYMGGPKPIAYTPYGELTVLLCFGLVGVLGTEWVTAASISAGGTVAALSVGLMASAALAVNNHRDIEHDRRLGRRTFAASFGHGASRLYFSTLLLAPYLVTTAYGLVKGTPTLALPLLTFPWAFKLQRDFTHCDSGNGFNLILSRSFKLGLAFNIALACGLMWITYVD